VRVVDSAGVSIISTTTTDSTGKEVTTRTIDSTNGPHRSALDIFRSLRARDDSALRVRADSTLRVGLRDSTQRLGVLHRIVRIGLARDDKLTAKRLDNRFPTRRWIDVQGCSGTWDLNY